MNVLHITAHLGAGAGKAIGGLAISDKKNHHKIVLLCEPQKTNHIEKCKNNGVEVVLLNDINYTEYELWADVIIYNWWGHKTLDRFIEQHSLNREKSVLWAHVNGAYTPKPSEELLDTFDRYMVTSQFSIDAGVFDSKKTTLIYGFGDFEAEKIGPKSYYDTSVGVFTIGYVGSQDYQKLSPDFVEYCTKVIKKVPTVKFVLVGETNKQLVNAIESKGLTEYFDFKGWTDNVYECLHSFDVFAYPMNKNTFATTENVILEAMACGLPMAISRYPLGKYQLVDGESGFLFDTPDEYADIIYQLYTNKHLREAVGQKAREYAIDKYSLTDNIGKFNAKLNEVAEAANLKEKYI
ncbi:glycosyltransferase family 4 protein [Desulfosporosinus sp. FKA]|uniref:glycosyltransferase family 4 protein n=1 Tax=Desulfosporosinus sp. FKA TaxID=1969834 RepID=UPI000B49C30B|nr:glycosyltransferase family 4 protein [Desulfosporosinus sp. FKA]